MEGAQVADAAPLAPVARISTDGDIRKAEQAPTTDAATAIAPAPAASASVAPPKQNLGSLLRLFRSSFFDVWMAVSYLYKYPQSGVQDYLCNQLYGFPDSEVEFYLNQLCHLAVYHQTETSSLERFILDKCALSMQFAVKVTWVLRSYVADNDPLVKRRCEMLLEDTETAVVNGRRIDRKPRTPSPLTAPKAPSLSLSVPQPPPPAAAAPIPKTGGSAEPSPSFSPLATTPVAEPPAPAPTPAAPPPLAIPEAVLEPVPRAHTEEELAKQARSECLADMLWFVAELGNVSERLRRTPVPARQQRLQEEIANLNSVIFTPSPLPLAAAALHHRLATPRGPLPGAALAPSASSSSLPLPAPAPPPAPSNTTPDPAAATPVVPAVPASAVPAPAASPAATPAPAPTVPEPPLRLPLPPLRGLYLPIGNSAQPSHAIIHVPPAECHILNSRERVPYLVYFEVIEPSPAPIALPAAASAPPQPPPLALPSTLTTQQQQQEQQQQEQVKKELDRLMQKVKEFETKNLQPAPPANEHSSNPAVPPDGAEASKLAPPPGSSHHSSFNSTLDENVTASLPFGETIEVKTARVRAASPYGHHPGWKLLGCIVKSGDELRQEQLATQIIAVVLDIFKQARLPLYLRPYNILVTSNNSGLIEAIPNVLSLHQLHKTFGASYNSLLEYFRKTYGADTHMFRLAQRNLVESLAGYSLLCYLLQVKDRHNGNILLDNEGHVIHIDFGFMLSNSPGSLGFETAPFKLTQEFVDVMEGVNSSVYHYFKALCVRGFLELRKHSDKVLVLVDMMAKGTKLPCFYGGQFALDSLRDRFCMTLTEEECVQYVENLITSSLDNWRTRHYDRYQYLTNSILY